MSADVVRLYPSLHARRVVQHVTDVVRVALIQDGLDGVSCSLRVEYKEAGWIDAELVLVLHWWHRWFFRPSFLVNRIEHLHQCTEFKTEPLVVSVRVERP
jgi:hypothetical protein